MQFIKSIKRNIAKSIIRRRNEIISEFSGEFHVARFRNVKGNYVPLNNVRDIRWSHEPQTGSNIYRFVGMVSKADFKRLDDAVFRALVFKTFPSVFTSVKVLTIVDTDCCGVEVTYTNPNI